MSTLLFISHNESSNQFEHSIEKKPVPTYIRMIQHLHDSDFTE